MTISDLAANLEIIYLLFSIFGSILTSILAIYTLWKKNIFGGLYDSLKSIMRKFNKRTGFFDEILIEFIEEGE